MRSRKGKMHGSTLLHAHGKTSLIFAVTLLDNVETAPPTSTCVHKGPDSIATMPWPLFGAKSYSITPRLNRMSSLSMAPSKKRMSLLCMALGLDVMITGNPAPSREAGPHVQADKRAKTARYPTTANGPLSSDCQTFSPCGCLLLRRSSGQTQGKP